MNVTFACPKCDRTSRSELAPDTASLSCSHCGHRWDVARDAVADGKVHRCVVCPSVELFVRKDFHQRLGVTIIAVGFLAATIAWYYHRQYLWLGILFASALLDVILYLIVGNVLQCYRCQSEYRGVDGLDEHGYFSLETHERYRQQAIRLQQAEAAQRKRV